MDLKQLVKEEEDERYYDVSDGSSSVNVNNGSGSSSSVNNGSGSGSKSKSKGDDNDGRDGGGGGGGGEERRPIDSGSALQAFLDHIPITPLLSPSPSSPVLELRSKDSVQDAISLMCSKNISGAPIIDNIDSDLRKFVDRDIGFIEFFSIALWSLEEFEEAKAEPKDDNPGFFAMLDQNPQIGQTKIAELAKLFLWEPFFPVNLNDTLFHVLLLFAKHTRLNVVPVVESSNSSVVGFIDQNAVVQLLLQSSGLEWFDEIADKPIADFGFENDSRFSCVYADQSMSDALCIMWKEQITGVPVVDKGNETLIGTVRCSDIYLLLEDDNIFNNRKSLPVEEFMKTSAGIVQRPNKSPDGCGSQIAACTLHLKDDMFPRANTVVTNQKSDSLKQAMKNMVASKSSESCLVNESGKLEGILTLRDIISQFSPPSLDSRIDGGGFFRGALEQAGCHVKDGTLICNR